MICIHIICINDHLTFRFKDIATTFHRNLIFRFFLFFGFFLPIRTCKHIQGVFALNQIAFELGATLIHLSRAVINYHIDTYFATTSTSIFTAVMIYCNDFQANFLGLSQTIFSDAFSWMTNLFVWVKFHWSSSGSDWQQSSIGWDNGLAPNRRQAIFWANADPIQRRIYAALGRDELIPGDGMSN